MKKGVWYVLLGAALWGILPIISRFLYLAGSEPVTAAAMRAYLAALIFLIWFLLDGTFKRFRLKELPFYIAYGLCGVGGTFLFYMLAIERLSTAMAAMLLYTGPAFVILFSRLFYREPITKVKLISLICSFGGCFLVVKGYDPSAFGGNLAGILIGLASGISYSMVTVMGRKAKALHGGKENAGLMIIFGSLVFLFFRPPWQISVPTFSLFAGYLSLALFCSVFAYIAYLKGLDSGLDGGIASITATAEPVIATLLGVLILRDPMEGLQVLGILIVICGVVLPYLPKPKKDG